MSTYQNELRNECEYDSDDSSFLASDNEALSTYDSDSDDDLACIHEAGTLTKLNEATRPLTRNSTNIRTPRVRQQPKRFQDEKWVNGSGCFTRKGFDETDMSYDGREV